MKVICHDQVERRVFFPLSHWTISSSLSVYQLGVGLPRALNIQNDLMDVILFDLPSKWLSYSPDYSFEDRYFKSWKFVALFTSKWFIDNKILIIFIRPMVKKLLDVKTIDNINGTISSYYEGARFICTVCTCRIRWSCKGLMSVTQQIHWIQLKHLLLSHMYNLSLPKLCATLLVSPTALLESLLASALSLTDWLVSHCTVCCLI